MWCDLPDPRDKWIHPTHSLSCCSQAPGGWAVCIGALSHFCVLVRGVEGGIENKQNTTAKTMTYTRGKTKRKSGI